MRTSHAVVWLAGAIAVLAWVAAGAGLLWPGGGSAFSFTTLRGETAQMYGQGLYRYDTFLNGAGNKGTDAVTIAVEIPLLIVAAALYRRGSLRGALLLLGALGWFLYYYASMALGAAYNPLFPIYLALFSTSFFAFILAFTSIDRPALPARFSDRLPRRGIAVYLFAFGAVFVVVWLGLSLLPAMLEGQPPKTLGSYSTLTTHVLDLGIITPAAFLAGVWFVRQTGLGYLLASVLILVNVTVGTALLGQGAAQLALGAPLTAGEAVGFMASFALLTLASIWLAIRLWRSVS